MTQTLFDAIDASDAASARALLGGGADANAPGPEGTTPLMRAAANGHLELVRMLIEAGADINARDEAGWSALMKATYNDALDRGFAEVAQALIDAGADIEARLPYGIRPLMLAAGYGQAGVVEVLLKAGAEVTARNDGGRTALMMVKDKHYIEVINQLHEAEMLAEGGGECGSRTPPGVNVMTFLTPQKPH